MARVHDFTVDEKFELVVGYMEAPYGTKAKWLEDRGISRRVMGTWRNAYLGGDLRRGLVPRSPKKVPGPGQRMVELEAKVKDQDEEAAKAQRRYERELEAQQLKYERLLEEQRRELAKEKGISAALGKAIGLLHELNERGPADSPKSSDPSTSPAPREDS